MTQADCNRIYNDAHVLVMPSIWPEPFGLTGPEAGLFGIPSVAFASGGILTWLKDGVNGHLAAANPPSARSLADALHQTFSTPEHYAELRKGAVEAAARFTTENHLNRLLPVFHSVANTCPRMCSTT
jgi:glycosyltransferase involved in cell wall biosynthesis